MEPRSSCETLQVDEQWKRREDLRLSEFSVHEPDPSGHDRITLRVWVSNGYFGGFNWIDRFFNSWSCRKVPFVVL